MSRSKASLASATNEKSYDKKSVRKSISSTSKDLQINARIRALDEQNEKLAAYAVQVSTEIEDLKRGINRCH
jgi:cell division protein FtsB